MNPINIAPLGVKCHHEYKDNYLISLRKQQTLRKEPLKMIFFTIFVVRWKCVNLVKSGYIK